MRGDLLNTLVFGVLPIASTRNLCAYETMDHSPLRPKFIRFIFAFFAALLVCSCTHKELCYDHSHTRNIEVVFDWCKCPDAEPKSMSLYLFPEDGGRPVRHEFVNKDGGKIRVVTGRYKAVCLNSDTRNITIQDEHDYRNFCISTKDAYSVSGLGSSGVSVRSLPTARGSEDERWVSLPEEVWSGSHDNIHIVEHGQVITLVPEANVRNYTLEIRNASNLRWINGMSASISSMAGGHQPSCKNSSEELVTIPIETRYDRNTGIVSGGFTSFGHCPYEDAVHQLVIYTVLADDSQWYYTYDVTEQIHDAADPFNIHIVLDGLPLPKPVVNGGGFKPTVGEWKEIEIKITM